MVGPIILNTIFECTIVSLNSLLYLKGLLYANIFHPSINIITINKLWSDGIGNHCGENHNI